MPAICSTFGDQVPDRTGVGRVPWRWRRNLFFHAGVAPAPAFGVRTLGAALAAVAPAGPRRQED
jgi:hypothetical protein